jgi:hypothetical protein
VVAIWDWLGVGSDLADRRSVQVEREQNAFGFHKQSGK